jgi:hypothetical protein
MKLYHQYTNRADLRQWYWIPKEIDVTRIEIKPGDTLSFWTQGSSKVKKIYINGERDIILFVRAFKKGDEVLYYVGQF